ncbi:uncharacterized protein LOC143277660 isoform X2 [Babylonia areolata]|uniref:uncharacterized protein LOC143277660 isoform X2 n=1 Tax=Babylonia areolata TaxID=304850 RepID=UPI003FD01275
METLGQEEKVSRGNRSADGPPAGVSSFAKVCRAESKGTDWARVNYILNIYGGVTLGLGTLMIIVAVFLYRKPPARDISMKYVSDQHQMMMMGGRQSGHGSSIHRFIRRGSRSGSRSFLPEHSQNVLRTSSSVFSSGSSAFGRPSASGVDTMSEVSSVATDTLSEASSSMAPSTVMSVSHVRGMHGQAGPGVYYL